MTERIDQLRDEAEAAIGAAVDTSTLEELRVRYLGRKAELPQMLREVAALPPEQRAAVGKAANEARQALESLIAARGDELAGAELTAQLGEDRIDVTLPGAPPQPIGGLHVLSATRTRIHLPRARLHGDGRP
jgi:phenylalanyl-tRNA synthetase alpha chain